MSSAFQLKIEGEEKAELHILEVIGAPKSSATAKAVIDQLKAMKDVKDIDVRISSVGGSGFEGIAIHNILERHPATKTVYVEGLAASAASVIAMAASPGKLYMASNARMMLHNSHAEADGDRRDMRLMYDRLQSLDDSMAATYAKRAKVSKEKISSMMDVETWLSAKDAIALGLADEMTGEVKIAAMADLSKFKNVPTDLAAQLILEVPEMTEQEIQAKIESSLKAAIDPLRAEHKSEIEKLEAKHTEQLKALGKTPPSKKEDEGTAPTDAEIRAEERTRTKDLTNLFASAGLKDSAVLDRWIDKGLSVVECKAEVGDLAIKQNKLVADDQHGDDENDPKAKYRAEYRKDMVGLSKLGIDEENFIHSRMVDNGEAVLMPGVKAKPAA